MVAGFARSAAPAAMEAALGFVLSRDAAISAAALGALAERRDGQTVPSSLVARLRRVRAWLPEERHAGIDAALANLEPLAEPAEPAPAAQILTVLATLPGGTGAQMMLVRGELESDPLYASVLLKPEVGVEEALLEDDLDEEAVERQIADAEEQAGGLDVPVRFFKQRLSAALAANHAAGLPAALQPASAAGSAWP